MFLQQIDIRNVVGIPAVSLSFENYSSVIVVHCPSACPAFVRELLFTSVQLICGVVSPAEHFKHAFVALKFRLTLERSPSVEEESVKPSTPRSRRSGAKALLGKFCHVKVCRDFSQNNGEIVKFAIDNEPEQSCNWTEFHARFFIDFEHILPHFAKLQGQSDNGKSAGEWLQLLSTDINSDAARESIDSLFERFFDISLATNANPLHELLSKLTKSCLLGTSALEVLQKALICKIFTDVRQIFENITYQEYTVWFLVPYKGELVDMSDVSTENLDFRNVITRIQLKLDICSRGRTYAWTNTEHYLQDLLLVAFQLSLAFHCKQRFICLRHLDRLASHQSFQMALAASLQYSATDDSNEPISKNYLQKIIDVCVQTGVTAIIVFPGGLPLAPLHASLVNCCTFGSGSDSAWHFCLPRTEVNKNRIE